MPFWPFSIQTRDEVLKSGVDGRAFGFAKACSGTKKLSPESSWCHGYFPVPVPYLLVGISRLD